MAAGFLLAHDLFGKPVPTFPDHALKPKTRPNGAGLERRDEVFGNGQAGRRWQSRLTGGAKETPAEPAAFGGHQRRNELVAKSFAQDAAKIADRVDEPEFQCPSAGPIRPGEQIVFRTSELAGAA